jgi:hypothetical protein
MGMGDQRQAPAAVPSGKTRYLLLGGSQGRSGRVLKISPLPGFDPQTVQRMASRYVDYPIPAHIIHHEGNIHSGFLKISY